MPSCGAQRPDGGGPWETHSVTEVPAPGVTVGVMRLPAPWSAGAQLAVRCVGFDKYLPKPVLRRELPSQFVNVLIGLGEPLVLFSGERGPQRRVASFVTGLQSYAAITQRNGHQRGVHIELSPLAAFAIFGHPMHELTDKLIDLSDLFGRTTALLCEQLAETPEWPLVFDRLSAALAGHSANGPVPSRTVVHAWRSLRASNGSVPIARLVADSGHSHRHLTAQFREQIGMTPKAVARLLRFEYSLALLRSEGAQLADVAGIAGYYDQAHLNRDFRALAGSSPRAVLAGMFPAEREATRPRSQNR
jgi:AraC-like DNA-binding protein